jgi:hypothetical protein
MGKLHSTCTAPYLDGSRLAVHGAAHHVQARGVLRDKKAKPRKAQRAVAVQVEFQSNTLETRNLLDMFKGLKPSAFRLWELWVN